MPHARRDRERTTSASDALPHQGNGLGYTSVGRRKGAVAQQGNGPAPSVGTHRDAVDWVVRRARFRGKRCAGVDGQAMPRHGASVATRESAPPGRAGRCWASRTRKPSEGGTGPEGNTPGPEARSIAPAPSPRGRRPARDRGRRPAVRVPGSPGGVDVGGTPRAFRSPAARAHPHRDLVAAGRSTGHVVLPSPSNRRVRGRAVPGHGLGVSC